MTAPPPYGTIGFVIALSLRPGRAEGEEMTMLDEGPSSVEAEESPRCLTSVGKALAILDAFDGAAALVGISEIARRSGLPKSTAYRLIASLEEQGFVERRGVRYCLGKRLFELGNQVSWCRPRNLRDCALPYMCELFSLTQRTVHLAVLDGTDVLYIEKLQGHDQPNAPTRVGGRVSARTTALGKAMLAFSSPATIEAALRVAPTLHTQYSIVLPEVFYQELAEVRRAGFAFDREEVRLGLTCVAAPILRNGMAAGAVSISGSSPGFDPVAVARRTRAIADAIAARLT
jgi:DNA-binding IclR family transcriptional regulator